MCEHGQHGSERAKACCEEDEEGKLFLWVHRHLVESWSEKENTRQQQHGVETTTTIIQLNWVGVFLRLHVAAAGVVLTGQ